MTRRVVRLTVPAPDLNKDIRLEPIMDADGRTIGYKRVDPPVNWKITESRIVVKKP